MHRLLDETQRNPRTEHAAEAALHLSVLAVGAQFAEASIQTRETQSQDLSKLTHL